MIDSPRWCEVCKGWGDHHTDRHPSETQRQGDMVPVTVMAADGPVIVMHTQAEYEQLWQGVAPEYRAGVEAAEASEALENSE